MLQVGITGSIGSGKSTVCKIFELLGIPIYYADDAAKRLMNEDKHLKQNIIQLLEEEAYGIDGLLDRKYVANIVFKDAEKLQKLNALVHPAVALDSAQWSARQNSLYTIKEAALLLESGSFESLDNVIVAQADLDLRLARVMQRDKVSREEVIARENKQFSQEQKLEYADFVIQNEERHSLVAQVLNIHQLLLKASEQKTKN